MAANKFRYADDAPKIAVKDNRGEEGRAARFVCPEEQASASKIYKFCVYAESSQSGWLDSIKYSDTGKHSENHFGFEPWHGFRRKQKSAANSSKYWPKCVSQYYM